MDRWCSKYLS